MKYQGDIGLYLSGAPVPLPECALFMIQPTVKQIIQFGETDFLMAAHVLGKTEEFLKDVREGNSELEHIPIFQLLMIVIHEDKTIKSYMDVFFELCFPDYDITYTENSINFYLKDDETKQARGMITMYSFDAFQTATRELFIANSLGAEGDYNPANEAAQKIAEKLKKGRERAAANKKGADENISLYGTYISILSVALQMNMNLFFDYTPFQLIDTFLRYQEKEKYDFYRKIASTPMMDVSNMDEPKEWTRNLYPSDNS